MKVDTKVLIVGCGAAGVTAAIALARRKIPVLVVEGAVYPGAENWSGAVYFCETLAKPEVLGEELLSQTPIERRIVRRGLLATDGRVAPGLAVHHPATFEHCYTVLRPVFDHDLAQKARMLGARILSDTTALALLRDGDTVRGVLTDRGPITAEVVFLAEGDASNLVQREGLERKAPGEDGLVRPDFLQGIKEVIDLPADVIERRFGVGAGEGACFELLLRNGVFHGQPVVLNAGAFLYTNRESVSLGLVAPLANLKTFKGAHNTLMEWFKGLPAIAPLLEGGKTRSFGAKLIRGGGFREMPRLVLDGLAVGGAASGLGVDFPCPNYTGPATFTGLAFAEAAAGILAYDGACTKDALETRYARRVEESCFYADSRHLEAWPHFVGSAREFFGRQVEVAAGLAHVATRGDLPPLRRRFLAGRFLGEALPWKKLRPLLGELAAADRALGLGAGWWKRLPGYLGHWVANLLVGWWPRENESGARLVPLLLHDGRTPRTKPFAYWRWMRWRLGPGFADALHHLYRNDGTTLASRLPAIRDAILTRLSLLDLVFLPLSLLGLRLLGALDRLRFGLWVKTRKPTLDRILAEPALAMREEARGLADLRRVKPAMDHDAKLALISYRGEPATHIRFLSRATPAGLPDNGRSPLFTVCPAKVYKQETDQSLGTSVAVLHENCIRCETCWRADDRHVDWGRTRGQRLTFEVDTPADAWLLESREAAALADLERPEAEVEPATGTAVALDLDPELRGRIEEGMAAVVRPARAFRALGRSLPSVLTGADQALLLALAEETLASVTRLTDVLHGEGGALAVRREALRAFVILAKTRLPARRFFHFEADVELLLSWHLPDLAARSGAALTATPEPKGANGHGLAARRSAVRALLEAQLGKEAVAGSEAALAPTPEARRALLGVAASLADPAGGVVRAGSPAREIALEELARLSPALAVLLSRHLAVLDLLHRRTLAAAQPEALAEVRNEVASGRVLATLVEDGLEMTDGRLHGTAVALLGGVDLVVVATKAGLAVTAPKDAGVEAAVVGGLGLRGAGPGRLRADHALPRAVFEDDGARASAHVRSAFDLVAVARGIAGYLFERALDHAAGRVQFPGLFRDLRGRDGIAKFGAVQDMLAGVTQGVEVLNSLFGTVGHGRTAAALAFELLGPTPRSVSYLAGQVLGGTAYSEEDAVCRYFRDAAALTRIPLAAAAATAEYGARIGASLKAGGPWLDLEWQPLAESVPAALPEIVRVELERVLRAAASVRDAVLALPPKARAGMAHDLGRFALLVEGARALALRTASNLVDGTPDPVLVAALEGFVRRVVGRGERLVRRLPDLPELVRLGRWLLDGRAEVPVVATGASYADYLNDGSRFASGDLLVRPGSGKDLAYTPELLLADAELSAYDTEIRRVWTERFSGRDERGRSYPRRVEDAHHVPLADIQWLLDGGYFRMVIPPEVLGLGTDKARYYVACTRMMRHGDPSQALIVMGSTSIGTMPILIGLEQDLPAAEASLKDVLAQGPMIAALREKVAAIRRTADTPEVVKIGDAMKALHEEVKGSLQKGRALRLVFADFLDAFQRAGMAGLRKDLAGFKAGLDRALVALDGWEARAQTELATLPHRKAAHEFYLRLISTQRISAFALTEPSAGSDTARIRTRAEVVEVAATADPRGFYRFVPAGGREERNLFDRDSLGFEDGRLVFRRPTGETVPVAIQDFDYAASPGAAESKFRYVLLDGERVDVHDLGRVERRGDGFRYRYFRTNGAKMWITNGSVAGVMVLYARTPAGPTGFMLDAHAEGLVVGKDEHKMGQRGSATNELSLTDVRIPVDQVIGIEGRGQENALETLNVGRAGLSICSVGLLHELVRELGDELRGRTPDDAAAAELGRLAVDLVLSEALAYQLVGRFDHPGTKTPRMESAIGKAFCSEAFHRALVRAERVLPADAVLDDRPFEKRRRDARVLTIYEGTNEIQRFLVLKDLVDGLEVDQFAFDAKPAESDAVAGARAALDSGRRALVERLRSVRSALGSKAWQTVAFQPYLFPLVDHAMRCATLAAGVQRLALAERLVAREGSGADRLEWLAAATGLFARDLERQGLRVQAAFDGDGRRLAAAAEPLAQVTADRALLRHAAHGAAHPAGPLARAAVTGVLRVAVVVDPRPIVGPTPRLARGALREPQLALSAADRGALAAALRLKQSAEVSVTVVGVGGPVAVDVLEETLALGADAAFLLDTAGRNLLAPDVAVGLADLLRLREELDDGRFDLVLGAEANAGVLLPLARRLEVPPLPAVHSFALRRELGAALEISAAVRKPDTAVTLFGPAMLLLDAEVSATAFAFTTEGWRRARDRAVGVIEFRPEKATEVELELAERGRAAPATAAPASAGSFDAVLQRFVDEAGLLAAAAGSGGFDGNLERRRPVDALAGLASLAVVEADAEGVLGPGARAAIAAATAVADEIQAASGTLVLLPAQAGAALRSAAGAVLAASPSARVLLLGWNELADRSHLSRARLLELLLAAGSGSTFFASELRTAALVAGEGLCITSPSLLLLDGVDLLEFRESGLVLSGLRFDRKVRFRVVAPVPAPPCHVVVAADLAAVPSRTSAPGAAAPAGSGEVAGTVIVLDEVPVPAEADALAHALRTAAKTTGASLADAEFIIDVGYGVGSRDGIEEVVEPLRAGLERLGVRRVTIGATRKVTMDLGLLPESCQIGQTGTPINPRILLALGVSGAPQHLDYIGPRAVVFAFNKDPEAPLVVLNRTRPRPLVLPILGDLFVEVPRFLAALEAHLAASRVALSV